MIINIVKANARSALFSVFNPLKRQVISRRLFVAGVSSRQVLDARQLGEILAAYAKDVCM